MRRLLSLSTLFLAACATPTDAFVLAERSLLHANLVAPYSSKMYVRSGACDDGDPCTLHTICLPHNNGGTGGPSLTCTPNPLDPRVVDCDDGDDTTLDVCDAAGECANIPTTSPTPRLDWPHDSANLKADGRAKPKANCEPDNLAKLHLLLGEKNEP